MDRISFGGADFPHASTVAVLQQQLFCYEKDLREVTSQKDRLLQRYQQLLHVIGRHDVGDDLLLNAVLQQVKLYLVTNVQGEILYASSAMEHLLGRHGVDLNWRAVDSLMSTSDKATVRSVLDALGHDAQHLSIQQRCLAFLERSDTADATVYDALVLKNGSGVRAEIYWLLNPVATDAASTLERQRAFPIFGAGAQALLMTDASATICAVSDAFTAITGFARAESVGANPRMLNSGLQEPEFYQRLWTQLMEAGGWRGEIFNRRKNGQVYFEWINIRKVQDEHGQTVSYLAAFSDLNHYEHSPLGLTKPVMRDAFAGLTNLRLLDSYCEQMLAKARRSHAGFAVLYLHGGFCGDTDDAILAEFGRRVRQAVRLDDVVVRVGRADYVVLLPNETNEEVVGNNISYLLYALDAPFHAGPLTGYADPSVGVARFPADGEDKIVLLDRAEEAMVRAQCLPVRFCFWK